MLRNPFLHRRSRVHFGSARTRAPSRTEPLERRVFLSTTIYRQPDGFDGDGWSEAGFDGLFPPEAIVRQADGKLLITGNTVLYERNPDGSIQPGAYDFTVARFNPDGTLDATFGGGDGIADIEMGGFAEHSSDLAVLPDGRIIVVGSVFGGAGAPPMTTGIIRLLPDGALDAAFGTAGKVFDHAGNDTGVRLGECVAIDAQGRILVGGNTRSGGPNEGSTAGKTDGVVTRYLPDGTRDASFGNNGVVLVAGGPGWGRVQDVAPAADGDVLVSSTVQVNDPVARDGVGSGFHLTRLNADGSRDGDFGTRGEVYTRIAGLNPEDMVLLPDGSILVGGTVSNGWDDDEHLFEHPGVLARYTAAGALDTSFGGSGTGWFSVTEALAPRFRFGGVAAKPDGKLVIVGSHVEPGADGAVPLDPGRRDFGAIVLQLDADGTLDAGFGSGGRHVIDTGVAIGADAVEALPDGSAVLAGYFRTARPNEMLGTYLARIGSDGQLPTAPPDQREEPPPPPQPPPPPPPPDPARYAAPFTQRVGGFRIEYAVGEVMGLRLPELHVRADDPAHGGRDDVVRVARNPSLPYAIDFTLNGETYTADFSRLGPRTNWNVETGVGNDKVEVTFQAGDESAANVFSSFGVHGGPGDDELSNGGTYAILSGDDGNDILRGGPVGEVMWGGPGIDQLYANDGNDILYVGQFGERRLEGEVYDGGPGDDRIGINLTLQPLPDDGAVDQPSPQPPQRPDVPPVTMAAYMGKTLVRKGKSFDFNLLFVAPGGAAIDPRSLSQQDIRVAGPNGVSHPAHLVRTKAARKGAGLVATYRLFGPGGVFDAKDNGVYTVQFRRGAVPGLAPAPRQFQRLVVSADGVVNSVAQDLAILQVNAKPRRGSR